MKTVLPVALVTFVLGCLAGAFYARRHVESPAAPVTATGGTAVAPDSADLEKRVADAEKKVAATENLLAKATQRNKELEARLEKGSSGGKAAKKALTPEEAAAKAEELKGKIKVLVEKKDGKALIKLMHELAALGEAGYAAAIEISGILSQDVEGEKGVLGISRNEFYMSFGGPMVPLMVWSMSHADDVPAGFRVGAAYALPWQRDADAGKIFLDSLKTEKNADVAKAMAENLEGLVRPEMASDLAALARANTGNPAVLMPLVQSLSGIGNEEAIGYLEQFARDENPVLKSEAEVALIAVHPPAAGLLITYTAPNSQAEVAGIRRGDVITTYNGVPVSNLDELRAEIGKTSGEELVTVMVNRKGEVVPLQIKGQKIGINGKAVAPK